MRYARSVITRANWNAAEAVGSLTLDHEQRHRRRIVLATDQGDTVLLDLAAAVHLRDGDGLLLDGGGALLVVAAAEALVQIHAHDESALIRIAYHLGNRHLAVQLMGDRILIRPDHVIEAMVERLGGHLDRVDMAFDPEGGAYGTGPVHGHSHDHDHAPHHWP